MAAVSDVIRSRGQKFGLYVNPGVAVAAVKQKTKVEGTNCTADQIALYDANGEPVRGNPFGDCYAIDWDGPHSACARSYIQSFANHLVLDLGIDFLKIDAVTPGRCAAHFLR